MEIGNEAYLPVHDYADDDGNNIWDLYMRLRVTRLPARHNEFNDHILYKFRAVGYRTRERFFRIFGGWFRSISAVGNYIASRQYITRFNITKIRVLVRAGGHTIALRGQVFFTAHQFVQYNYNTVRPLLQQLLHQGEIPQHIRDLISGDDEGFIEAAHDRDNLDGVEIFYEIYENYNRRFYDYPLMDSVIQSFGADPELNIYIGGGIPPYDLVGL